MSDKVVLIKFDTEETNTKREEKKTACFLINR